MERVKITLEDDEYRAVVKLSERELRSVPEQIRATVRERLRRAGLLSDRKQEVQQYAK